MKFWFCETCGKRLTDRDVEAGAARNKKLNGVFCEQCAVGVMTMEMAPISEAQAKQMLGKTIPKEVYSQTRPKRQAPEIRNAATHRTVPPLTATSAGNRTQAIFIGVGGGLLIAGVLIIALVSLSGVQTDTQRRSAETPQATPTQLSGLAERRVESPSASKKFSKPSRALPTEVPPSQPNEPGPSSPLDIPRAAAAPESAVPTDAIAAVPEITHDVPPNPKNPEQQPSQPVQSQEPSDTPNSPAPKPLDTPIEAERLATRAFLERMFRALREGAASDAAGFCRTSKLPLARDALSLLERGQELRKKAIEKLNRQPPTETLKFRWKEQEVTGQLVRIEGNRAWIKSGPMELAVGMESFPREVWLKGFQVDDSAQSLADQAVFHFSCGEMDAATAALAKLEPDAVPGLRRILAQLLAQSRQDDFEAAVAAVETAIRNGKRNHALDLVGRLTNTFPEWANGAQKARIDRLTDSARNTGLAKTLVQKALKAEILRVDDDLYVELFYDFVKNPRCVEDFTDKNLAVIGEGLSVEYGPRFAEFDGVRNEIQFSPRRLRVEYLIEAGAHDLYLSRIGNVQFKLRWGGPGQMDVVFESTYTGGWRRGIAWNRPRNTGSIRFVFDRTPDDVRLLLDGVEKAKAEIPALLGASATNPKSEDAWTIGIVPWKKCTIKEILIKGTIDREWLQRRATGK